MSIQERIKTIRQRQQQQQQYAADKTAQAFLVSPTCPPSTAIQIHGGTTGSQATDSFEAHYGLVWTVPSLTRDLADPDSLRWSANGLESPETMLTWDNAGWYHYCQPLLLIPETLEDPTEADWQLRLRCWSESHAAAKGYALEYETATEAEAALMAFVTTADAGYDTSWPYANTAWGEPPGGMPLCGLILRHDGSTEMTSFLPIDLVNRGRSYIWPRDLRPRWIWV